MRNTLFSRPFQGLRTTLAAGAVAVLAVTMLSQSEAPTSAPAPAVELAAAAPVAAAKPNPATPGDFTGYGFDQCVTPTQSMMDAWLQNSPFLAVGIYISGKSRACRDQPNLTPGWVSNQLAKGWRLLPITLGPQASCQPRFPRYSDDVRIDPARGSKGVYTAARRQGVAEAGTTVTDAKRLGIVPGSTLWYDLEGFDSSNRDCRESALAFLTAWTRRLHQLDYVSGVYSSAGSGIAALDAARISRPANFIAPDRVWVARWDGQANTSTSYMREDGWRPGGRIKQYRGGHDEVWGGVRINIDSNFLDMGRGSVAPADPHCGGVNVNFATYVALRPPSGGAVAPRAQVKALQCLLTERTLYSGSINGHYNPAVVQGVRAWQRQRSLPAQDGWTRQAWMTLLSTGYRPVQKFGSAGTYTRRVQRTLNAADDRLDLRSTGVYDAATVNAVRRYQTKVGIPATGVTNDATWGALKRGRF